MKPCVIMGVIVCLGLAGCGKAPSKGADSKADKAVAAAAPAALECSATATEWLPTTPKPSAAVAPLPTPDDDDQPKDCFFYRGAWQNFLFATAPETSGDPAFLSYPNIATLFGSNVAGTEFKNLRANAFGVALRDIQRPNALPAHPSTFVSIAEGVRQAGGLFGLVVDANGNPVFYSIHVNQEFATFIHDKGLTTKAAVEKDPKLEFPPGVAEFKAAWVIVPEGAPDDPNYINTTAHIPNLQQDAKGVLRLGAGTRTVKLKLIALHVAFVIQDHPEFVWATFEHVTPGGDPDLAPLAASNDPASAVSQIAGITYTLFAPGAGRSSANSPCPGKAPAACDPTKDHPTFDVGKQSFSGPQTSIFREFRASKSDRAAQEDQSVLDLNTSMKANLASVGGKRDVRANYRLVGATWLEHPRDGGGRLGDFVEKRTFQNAAGQDTEKRSRIVAGEDMLSSVAMESFTQRESPSCFSCHDTSAVRSDEPDGHVILKPGRLNVSHVISRFLSGAN